MSNNNLGTVQNLVDWFLKPIYIYTNDFDIYIRLDDIYDRILTEYPEFKNFDTFVSKNELLFELYDFDITSVDYINENGIYVKTKQRIYSVAKSLYGYYSSFNEDGSLPDYEY